MVSFHRVVDVIFLVHVLKTFFCLRRMDRQVVFQFCLKIKLPRLFFFKQKIQLGTGLVGVFQMTLTLVKGVDGIGFLENIVGV